MPSNRLFSTLRLATLCVATLAAPAAWSLDAGAAAPDLNLPGLKDAVNLAALKGKVVYVDFWASWCGPCKQSFPFMNELQSKYGAKGFEIVAVNLDAKRGDADKFLAEVPAHFNVAFDAKGETARRFEVKGMPSSYLIGRDGKVIAAHKGFKEEERTQLDARIAQALATP
ncbi:MAG: TlpA family protein disulfide reductase [Burkholderiales bacterium]|nr:TlpA family protein disulfide reductase [Burkholderiales bacterium]MDE2297871.1 TlpA family protein disulfide reductase [Burkholderiales bacterium]MDE2627366.1 TlpA family protein disulfide reductase [Burkholderiales bacterium]